MNNPFAVLFCELLILYILSRNIHKYLGRLITSTFKNIKLTVWIMAIMVFPGTFIHELSHLLSAQLLGVQTGRIKLLPSIDAEKIILGSVPIEKVGIIKKFIIGTSPLFVGLILFFCLMVFIGGSNDLPILARLSVYYAIFVLTNTMFPSTSDVKGTWVLVLSFIATASVLFYFGLRINFPEKFIILLNSSTQILKIALILNTSVLAVMFLISKLVFGKVRFR